MGVVIFYSLKARTASTIIRRSTHSPHSADAHTENRPFEILTGHQCFRLPRAGESTRANTVSLSFLRRRYVERERAKWFIYGSRSCPLISLLSFKSHFCTASASRRKMLFYFFRLVIKISGNVSRFENDTGMCGHENNSNIRVAINFIRVRTTGDGKREREKGRGRERKRQR